MWGRSTMKAIYPLYEDWWRDIGGIKNLHMVFIDLEKIHDRMPEESLLNFCLCMKVIVDFLPQLPQMNKSYYSRQNYTWWRRLKPRQQQLILLLPRTIHRIDSAKIAINFAQEFWGIDRLSTKIWNWRPFDTSLTCCFHNQKKIVVMSSFSEMTCKKVTGAVGRTVGVECDECNGGCVLMMLGSPVVSEKILTKEV